MMLAAWITPAVAVMVWLAVVVWPAIMLANEVLSGGADFKALSASPHTTFDLLATSLGWSAAVAVAAMIVGWLPGKLLGRTIGRRSFIPLAAMMIVPLCLPSYLVFYAWWQSWPAGTALHRWVIERDLMQFAREATLLAGLACWSWPLVALCVAGAASRRHRARDDLLAVDGASSLQRFIDHVRTDAPGLLIGGALVFLATINNTTCFDLAEVFTFANDMRAQQALGASPAAVLQHSFPLLLVAAIGGGFVWRFTVARGSDRSSTSQEKTSVVTMAIVALVWMASVALPLGLFWRGAWASGSLTAASEEYFRLYWQSSLATMLWGAVSGAIAAIVAMGLALSWHSEHRVIRIIAGLMSVSWIFWCLLPGTLIGLGLHHAWSSQMYRWPVEIRSLILSFGHMASFGLVAVLLGRWCARSEPASVGDLRAVDSGSTPTAVWRTACPWLIAAALASGVIVGGLGVGEIAVTAMIVPPLPVERTPIAMTLLNEMHYQRPQTVMVASIGLVSVGLIGALLVAVVWQAGSRFQGIRAAAMLLALTMWNALGCSPGGATEPQPLDVETVFGSPGQALGQFGYPRCIDADRDGRFIYVIDKTARVQRFSSEGEPQLQWHMPERENGKPTGVTVAPNGHVLVADTHYFRVIEYTSDGREVRRFGSYGEEPGQFIYLTDIAVASDGRLFVSEYGGNDRIQVFSPEGDYLYEFGGFGRDFGQFSRPQSMGFNKAGTELFIADACNHRIVVTDLEGNWLRTFGSSGREPGQLAYPYGLEVLPDGTILVAEFGNNRIQRFTAGGESLGVFGRVGRGEGELQYPWAIASTDDLIYVLDSGNNRVQVIDQF